MWALRHTLLASIMAVVLSGGAQAQDTLRRKVAVPASPVEAGDIRANELEMVAPRVALLKLESVASPVHIGDTLSLDTAIVMAYDSAGVRLGRLRIYDMELKPGSVLAGLGPRKFVARGEGTGEIILRYPKVAWRARTDDPLFVRFLIDVVR